jgi:peptidoglycan/xylan/chitin deacetylase (PgdA/CDA1 family)
VRPSWRWRGAVVLGYHAVTSAGCLSQSVANIPFDQVKSGLTLLRRYREIIPLRELLQRQANARSVAGLAAITFDDAYASMGAQLVPWLRDERIPCSIFVTTNASAVGERFWWDRVDDAFLQVDHVRWREFENRVGVPDAYRHGQPKGHGPLRPLRQYILSHFRGRWPEELAPVLSALEADIMVPSPQRAMTFGELDELAKWDGLDIGVHTRSHPVMPLLSDDELDDEVRGSWKLLRTRYARAIPVLAIPFGLFDARTLRLSAAAGMQASLTLANRLVKGKWLPSQGVPRLSMTRQTKHWKLLARCTGVLDAVFDSRPGVLPAGQYPRLPSANT